MSDPGTMAESSKGVKKSIFSLEERPRHIQVIFTSYVK